MTNEQYYELIRPYEDVSRIMLTKLEILNHSIYSKDKPQPIHHMQNRIKKKKSIEGKLERLKLKDSVMNAKDRLMDIAGIRVICYFPEEIYDVVDCLKRQTDMIVIKEKDYSPVGTAAFISCLGCLSTVWMPWSIIRWRSSFGPCPWISGPAWSIGSVIRENMMIRIRSAGKCSSTPWLWS